MLKMFLAKALFIKIMEILKLFKYYDIVCAGSPSDRGYPSRYFVLVGGNLISWKSKKPNVGALPSIETKYKALALVTWELIWLK